jgi:hypothetical protein
MVKTSDFDSENSRSSRDAAARIVEAHNDLFNRRGSQRSDPIIRALKIICQTPFYAYVDALVAKRQKEDDEKSASRAEKGDQEKNGRDKGNAQKISDH